MKFNRRLFLRNALTAHSDGAMSTDQCRRLLAAYQYAEMMFVSR